MLRALPTPTLPRQKSGQFICYKTGQFYLLLRGEGTNLLEANKLPGGVAHNLSGLKVTLEVTDETDRVDAGDPEDAI
jgi:hypothetical protein